MSRASAPSHAKSITTSGDAITRARSFRFDAESSTIKSLYVLLQSTQPWSASDALYDASVLESSSTVSDGKGAKSFVVVTADEWSGSSGASFRGNVVVFESSVARMSLPLCECACSGVMQRAKARGESGLDVGESTRGGSRDGDMFKAG